MSSPMAPKPTFRDRIEARVSVLRKLEKYSWVTRAINNNLMWGIIFTLLVTLLLVPLEGIDTKTYQINDVVDQAIIAPEDIRIPDEFSTNQKKQERINSLQTIYIYNDRQWRSYAEQIDQMFNIAAELVFNEQLRLVQPRIGGGEDYAVSTAELADSKQVLRRLQANIERSVQLQVPEEVLQALLRLEFADELRQSIHSIIEEVMGKPIVNTTLYPPRETGYQLIPRHDAGKSGESIVPLTTARARMKQMAETALPGGSDAKMIIEWLQNLVEPTSVADEAKMREQLASAQQVETLYFDVKRGEVIVRKGDRISNQDQLAKVNYILNSRSEGINLVYKAIAILVFTSVFLYALYKFAELRKRRRKISFQLFLMLCLILFTNIVSIKIVMAIGESLAGSIAGNAQSYYWAIPFAMGSMLVTLLVGTQIAVLYAVVLVFLSGFLVNGVFNLVVFALIGCFISIYGVRQYKERTAVIKSGIILGLFNMVTIFLLNLNAGNLDFDQTLLVSTLIGFTGGILTSFLVSFMLPILESLFKVITDIKLLELSNHEHPLLRNLFLNAPGTFQHSIVVGYLSEAAASSINANSLFCRVACLYHDIGKMLKPLYFVENSDDHGKKHDKLSPHMSALIISSHVKEGIELARKYRLPESIIDIIPQHHGTKLIKYFFEKARKNKKADDVQVKEEEFRYPGPKPQTREAGIIMIADGVEAAARSLDEPTPGRLKGTIKAIIDNTFLDGQLDECDLTLKDLTKISEAFLKILLSMKHERIKYPGFNLDKQAEKENGLKEEDNDGSDSSANGDG